MSKSHAIAIKLISGRTLICLSRADAAERLGISSRTLYERTAPRGPICSVRFGRRVLYPISEIDRYITSQIALQTRDENGGAK